MGTGGKQTGTEHSGITGKTASPAKIKTIKNMCTSHGIDGDAWVTSNGKTWETLTEGEAAKMLAALKGKFGDD